MKRLLFMLVGVLIIGNIYAQRIECNTHISSKLKTSLIVTASSVSKTFGPDYKISGAEKIIIEGPLVYCNEFDSRPEIQKNNGREYYSIRFYPKDLDMFDWEFYSKVDIWADGTPQGIIYGNGYGVNFLFDTFESQRIDPLRVIIPLQYSDFYKNK